MNESIGSVLERSLGIKQPKSAIEQVVAEPDQKPVSTKIKVEDLPKEQKPAEVKPPVQEAAPQEHYALLGYFNIDRPDEAEDNKLYHIWQYIKTHNPTTDKALLAFVRLKNKLGSPRIGESPLDRVYRYVKLQNQAALVKEELRGV